MRFDKSKVYTALNADEVKVGSKGFFADNLECLQMRVEAHNVADIHELVGVNTPDHMYRFCSDDSDIKYVLFYPVEEELVPFDDTQELKIYFKQKFSISCAPTGCAPFIWVKEKTVDASELLITGFTDISVLIDSAWYSMQELFENFVFLDGETVGKKVSYAV